MAPKSKRGGSVRGNPAGGRGGSDAASRPSIIGQASLPSAGRGYTPGSAASIPAFQPPANSPSAYRMTADTVDPALLQETPFGTPTAGPSQAQSQSQASQGSLFVAQSQYPHPPAPGQQPAHDAGHFMLPPPPGQYGSSVTVRTQAANNPATPSGRQGRATIGGIAEAGLPTSQSTSSLTQASPGAINNEQFLFVITKQKRVELRKALEAGKTVERKHKIVAGSKDPLTDVEKETGDAKIDRATRWNTFLVHTNLNFHDIIVFVYGDRIDVDSRDYAAARQKILENHRSYKSKTCKHLKTLVERLIAQDESLMEISDASFFTKFSATFNETNFFSCVNYMKNYLNIDGSSDLGKWFIKSVYANLGIEIRKFMKKGSTKDAWEGEDGVLDLYDKHALLPIYDDVDIGDFQQLTQKFRNVKATKKRDFRATQEAFMSIGPVPKKAAVAIPASDFRTGQEVEDLDEYGDDEEDEAEDIETEGGGGAGGALREFGGDAAFDDPALTPTPRRQTRFDGGTIRSLVEANRINPLEGYDTDDATLRGGSFSQ